MFKLLQKYSSKLVFFTFITIFILSCAQKSKYGKHQRVLSDTKMIVILEDVLIMESYVMEKLPNLRTDSLNAIKNKFYAEIFKKHKVDSASFYSTLYYFQVRPIEFDSLLNKVDLKLSKIVPKDTTRVIQTPQMLPTGLPVGNVVDEEKKLKEQFAKHFPRLNENLNKDSL